MKHITLDCGFECDVDEAVLDDFELFDAVAEVEAGNILKGLPVVVDKILGKRKKEFYNYFRNEAGRVPMEQASAAIADLFQQIPAAKN